MYHLGDIDVSRLKERYIEETGVYLKDVVYRMTKHLYRIAIATIRE